MTLDKQKNDGIDNQHASIEQLLAIKDGATIEASDHVQHCFHCQSELVHLELIAQSMFDSADCAVPADLWDRIQSESQDAHMSSVASFSKANFSSGSPQPRPSVPDELVYQASQTARSGSLNRAIYTLAGSVLFTGLLGLFMFNQNYNQQMNQIGISQQQNLALQANIEKLMTNSQGMELTLQKVALQSELLTASERSTADKLYWRLAMLDQTIQDNNQNSESNPQMLEALWNDRIDALNALNQLYYQRQQSFSLSEI